MPRAVSHLAATVARAAVPLVLALGLATGCRASTGVEEQLLTMEVAESRVPCVGIGPQECLQVRTEADAPWQLFYDGIEGFTHEPGVRYVLLVARRDVPNPPADASSVAYRLLRVLSRTPASP